jgi:Tfp pilus assembly protein PilF
MPVDVDLLAIYPHAHHLGRELAATATFPDGSTKTLINIPRWDLNWQAVFYYEERVFLPKDTVINMRYVYDNSASNIANPHRPPQRVRGGNRSVDEMAHLWLQVLPHGDAVPVSEAAMLLDEALWRHDVARNPADFTAQYNLGAILQLRGQTSEALPHYQAAVALRPADAIANNALGGALLALGQTKQAIAPLQAAIQSRPNYFAACYNLGNANAALHQFPQAISHFRKAVQLNPEDSMAEANLGAALAEVGELASAKAHLERALKLDPQNQLAQDDLQEVQRRQATPHKP